MKIEYKKHVGVVHIKGSQEVDYIVNKIINHHGPN